jgi:hypothetical protein
MNSTTGTGVCGARPHGDRARTTPVDSIILRFKLCTQLMECYIINSIGFLAMDVLYVYIHRVINKVWNLL